MTTGKVIWRAAMLVVALAVATSCDDTEGENATVDAEQLAQIVAADSLRYDACAEAMSAHLATAILAPDVAKERLRNCVAQGVVIASPSWPLAPPRLLWAMAAWEVYLAQGDVNWLLESYQVVSATLDVDLTATLDTEFGLSRGAPLWASASIDAPDWYGKTAQYDAMSLTTNVALAQACVIAERMKQELASKGISTGIVAETSYAKQGASISAAVNNLMWAPQQGYYAGGIYQAPFAIQLPTVEPIGQALASITGIANRDMAQSIVRHTPIPCVTDSCKITDFNRAYWSWLGNRAQSPETVDAALGNTSLDIDAESTMPQAATRAAMILRGVFGVELRADQMTINPTVPRHFSGEKHVYNIPYRNCKVNITVNGTGSQVESWSINDTTRVGSPHIAATATGRIDLVINLNNDHSRGPTPNRQRYSPPAACSLLWDKLLSASIVDPQAQSYQLFTNGLLTANVDSRIELSAPKGYNQVTVTPFDHLQRGFSSQPHALLPADLNVDTETPLTDCQPYIFVTPTLPRGRYIATLTYSCPDEMPHTLCQVTTNDQHSGSLLLAPPSTESSSIVLNLTDGNNRIVITPYPLPHLNVDILNAYTISHLNLTPLSSD